MDVDYDFSSQERFCSDGIKCPLAEKCKRYITEEEMEQMNDDGKMIWLFSYLSLDEGVCKHFLKK